MCVIYACVDKLPSEEELLNGEKVNDDGGGLAWVEAKTATQPSRVVWIKNLSAKEVVSNLAGKSLPLLIHFRIASEGGVCPELTHPFPITKEAGIGLTGAAPAVLMHNGTWHIWKSQLRDAVERSCKPLPAGPWSDTRAIAWLLGNFGPGYVNFISGHGKLAILRADGVLLYGPQADWIKGDGYFQSSRTKSIEPIIQATLLSRGEGKRAHRIRGGQPTQAPYSAEDLDFSTRVHLLAKEFEKGNMRLIV